MAVGDYMASGTADGTTSYWGVWMNDQGTSANTATWTGWTGSSASNSYTTGNDFCPLPETEEQRQARLERERVDQERRAQERAKRNAADERARLLLEEFLSPTQLKQWIKDGTFFIETPNGKLFKLGKKGTRELNGKEQAIASYCIHTKRAVPQCDNILARKLLLETDEGEFRRIANRTLLYGH